MSVLAILYSVLCGRLTDLLLHWSDLGEREVWADHNERAMFDFDFSDSSSQKKMKKKWTGRLFD